MPAPRKPSAVLERNGSFQHNAKRRRKDPKGRGELPTAAPAELGLDQFQARAWQEIVDAIPEGVGTGSDRFVVELTARALGTVRRTGQVKAAELAQLRVYLGSLALSPADRAKLATAPDDAGEDPFAEFGGGAPGAAAGPRAVSKTLAFSPKAKR